MEKTSTLINNIYSDTQEYIRLQTHSAKLEVYERVTNLVSSGISGGVIALFGIFSFLFLSCGLAFWLSQVLHSMKLGFLAVGAFYLVVMGIYILLKDKIATNRVKNAVLLKVSKTHHDYDLLLKEQEIVHLKVEKSEKQIADNFNELKENIETLKDDFKKLKGNFVSAPAEEGEEKVGAKIPRIAITSIVDLLLNKVLLKNSGFLSRALVPLLTNTLLTSTVFKENKKTSLTENLKLKFSKFLG